MNFNHYYSSSPDVKFYWKGNPLFIDTEVFDFQLQSTSPCIDTGDPAYTPAENELDFNHNPRKVGACIDKGAYEKQ